MIISSNSKIVFIGSTGGSLFEKLIKKKFIRRRIAEVVTDRHCNFLKIALENSIPAELLRSSNGEEFSKLLTKKYSNKTNLIYFSFYTKLFTEPFLSLSNNYLFNFHPTLLPAFPGIDGLNENFLSSSKFLGCTIHKIIKGVDNGPIVLQAAVPFDNKKQVAQSRHLIFMIQYITTLQFIKWISEERVLLSKNSIKIKGAKYAPSMFSPNLDDDFWIFYQETNPFLIN